MLRFVQSLKWVDDVCLQFVLVTEPVFASLADLLRKFSGIPVESRVKNTVLSQLEIKHGLLQVFEEYSTYTPNPRSFLILLIYAFLSTAPDSQNPCGRSNSVMPRKYFRLWCAQDLMRSWK